MRANLEWYLIVFPTSYLVLRMPKPPILSSERSQQVAAEHLNVIRGLYRVSRTLGWLGIFLPTALILHGLLWNDGLQPSISHAYHTAMGDVLVGTLCAIGIFLIAYKDFNPEEYLSDQPDKFFTGYWDRWFARAAGVGAIGVALFPVDPIIISSCSFIVEDAPNFPCSTGGATWHGHVTLAWEGGKFNNLLHFFPAGLFFFCTCIMCFRFFPEQPIKARYLGRNEQGEFVFELRRPNKRTLLFSGLGLLIAFCIAGLAYMTANAGSNSWLFKLLAENKGFFWIEVVAVVAFAIAWLTKSQDFKPENFL